MILLENLATYITIPLVLHFAASEISTLFLIYIFHPYLVSPETQTSPSHRQVAIMKETPVAIRGRGRNIIAQFP